MEASPAIQQKFKLALQEFLNEPTTPTAEFHRILQALKAKAAPPPPQLPSQIPTPETQNNIQNPQISTTKKAAVAPVVAAPAVDENEERKNRMIKSIDTRVERKRRDIQERYRKRM
jgi:hypothetical protein